MFDSLALLPPDPILGLMAKFRADANPNKIDLGVGVYRDDEGKTPVLAAVKDAERIILANEDSKAYVGPAGNQQFNQLLAQLVFTPDHCVIQDQRAVLLQTPGGCGALRVAAELFRKVKSPSRIWVSDPTWANHVPLLGDAGIQIEHYPYYDYRNHSVRFDAMCEQLQKVAKGDYVLLHACCHNPCGADLSEQQWQQIADLAAETGFIPFIDMAYQGFGRGLEADAYGLRLLASRLPEVVFAVSCSKNFGLYRERVGAVGVVASDRAAATTLASYLARIVRGIYSMPPSHGATIVEKILSDETLRAGWITELDAMRMRITNLRSLFVAQMTERGMAEQFNFILKEKGMFSFLGLTPQQVQRLAAEFAIYMVDSSRINIAGLGQTNMPYFCDALIRVLNES